MKNKGIFIGLIFLTIFVIFFGLISFKNRIEGPFKVVVRKGEDLTQEEIQNLLAQKDSDQDGLSDVDEVFKYKTSAYLVDSDADGYNDKEEIEAGSNPLDPALTPVNKKVVAGPTNEPVKEELTIREIRERLIQMGLPQETLDKVDDETLKNLYNETIAETGINPEEIKKQAGGLGQLDFSKIINLAQPVVDQPITNQTNTEPLTGFENLDPKTIRQLMLVVGANPDLLNQIDDETLKTLFLKGLKEAQK